MRVSDHPLPAATIVIDDPEDMGQEIELSSPLNSGGHPVFSPAPPTKAEATYDVALTIHHVKANQSATWIFESTAVIEQVRERCQQTWSTLFVFRCDNETVDISSPLAIFDPTINRHGALSIFPFPPRPANELPVDIHPVGREVIAIKVYNVRTRQKMTTHMRRNTCVPA